MLSNFAVSFTITVLFVLHVAQGHSDMSEEDYDNVLESLKTEKFIHSGLAQITRAKPCMQITASGVTVEKAISRLSKKITDIDPKMKFDVAYCGTDTLDEPSTCAINSVCTTVYRWQKARTRSVIFGTHDMYVEDKVLLPLSCMCVLGKDNKDSEALISTPIVIL